MRLWKEQVFSSFFICFPKCKLRGGYPCQSVLDSTNVLAGVIACEWLCLALASLKHNPGDEVFETEPPDFTNFQLQRDGISEKKRAQTANNHTNTDTVTIYSN